MVITIDPLYFNLRVTVHREQNCYKVTLPKKFIDTLNIKHGEDIDILINRHYKEGKVIELVDAKIF